MSNWTKEQLDAINARGNVLVSASAGSGKTSVMIERILQIVLNGEAEVDQILATTFTHLAADQIKEKLNKALKDNLKNNPDLIKQLNALPYASISTIHSFCGNLIKTYFYALGIDASYKILENADLVEMQYNALNTVFNTFYEEKNPEFLSVAEKFFHFRSDEELKKEILSLYALIRNETDPLGYLDKALNAYTPSGLKDITNLFFNDIKQEVKEVILSLQEYLSNLLPYEKLSNFAQSILSDANLFLAENNIDKCYNLALSYSYTAPRKNEDDSTYTYYLDIAKRAKEALKDIYATFCGYYTTLAEQDNYFKIYNNFKTICTIIKEFDKEYSQLKKEAGALDFSDLEQLCIKLLSNQEIANDVKNKYKFIFIDEYQDVNPAQEFIIKKISNNNLFLVGDIKQSIYQFRGCNCELFTATQQEYHSNPTSGTNLSLNKNFRSAKGVIDTVNNIFSTILTTKGGCDYKNQPMVYGEGYDNNYGTTHAYYYTPTKEVAEEVNPKLYDLTDYLSTEDSFYKQDAQIILDIIKANLGNKYYSCKDKCFKTIGYKDIVILVRGLGSSIQKTIKFLSQNGVKLTVNNKKDTTIYPEIAMLTDILKLVNCHLNNESALITGLKWIGNCSNEDLVLIRKHTPDKKISFTKAVYLYDKADIVKEKIDKFLNIANSLILSAELFDANMVLQDLLSKTDIEAKLGIEYYGEDKIRRIYRFIELAKGYSVDEFLQKLALNTFVFSTPTDVEDAVRVMTIHSSKGLEFPIVILAECDKPFNKKDLEKEFIFDRDLGVSVRYHDTEKNVYFDSNPLRYYIKYKYTKKTIQEEIRLLYVALTRAEYNLYLVGKTKALNNDILPFEINSKNNYISMIKNSDIKNSLVEEGSLEEINTSHKEILMQNANQNLVEKIKEQIEFTYPQKAVVPLKTSVSNVSFNEHKIYDTTQDFGESSAEKGSAYHKFLECWDFKQNFLDYYNSTAKVDLLQEEYNLIDINVLTKICNMEVFSLIKDFTLYKEKQFFVSVPYNLISNEQTTQEVVVQGTIDLLAIKDNKAIIIDYKLSTIASQKDLISKYKTQLTLYAYAVKKLLNINVECYLINILNQTIIKLDEKELLF